MEKLQQPFDAFTKHLKDHHKLTIHCEIAIYEQEKDVFCFGYFFYEKKKSIFGKINMQQKTIVYEISKYKYSQGEGFHVFSPIKRKLEQLTY